MLSISHHIHLSSKKLSIFAKPLSLLIIGCLLLSGCAHRLTRAECFNMNWRQLGFKDGSQGYPISDLAKPGKDCGRFEIPIDHTAYRKGWRQGIRTYCTPDMAYQRGTDGLAPINYCPSDLAPAFHRAWRRGIRHYCIPEVGYRLGKAGQTLPGYCPGELKARFEAAYYRGHAVRTQIKNIRQRMRDTDYDIKRLRNDITDAERDKAYWEDYRVTDSGITMAERNRKLRRARNKLNNLRDQLYILENRRQNLERDLTTISLHH